MYALFSFKESSLLESLFQKTGSDKLKHLIGKLLNLRDSHPDRNFQIISPQMPLLRLKVPVIIGP